MSDTFYIQVRGRKQGPYTADRLRRMAKMGRFGRQHRVSRDGRRWKPAEEFPELFRAEGERKQRQDIAGVAPAGTAAPPGAAPGGTDPLPAGSSSQGWHYSHGGQQYGPVSFEVIRHAQATGQLTATDLVWTAGMAEWKQADRAFPGLFSGEASGAGSGAAGAAAPAPGGPAGMPQQEGIVPHAPMSNLALSSLVLSFIPIIGSIAAVICGHLALAEIHRSGGAMNGRKFAVAGLAIGYGILSLAVLYGLFWLSSSAFAPGDVWTPELVSPPRTR